MKAWSLWDGANARKKSKGNLKFVSTAPRSQTTKATFQPTWQICKTKPKKKSGHLAASASFQASAFGVDQARGPIPHGRVRSGNIWCLQRDFEGPRLLRNTEMLNPKTPVLLSKQLEAQEVAQCAPYQPPLTMGCVILLLTFMVSASLASIT